MCASSATMSSCTRASCRRSSASRTRSRKSSPARNAAWPSRTTRTCARATSSSATASRRSSGTLVNARRDRSSHPTCSARFGDAGVPRLFGVTSRAASEARGTSGNPCPEPIIPRRRAVAAHAARRRTRPSCSRPDALARRDRRSCARAARRHGLAREDEPDLKLATVYVMPLGGKDAAEVRRGARPSQEVPARRDRAYASISNSRRKCDSASTTVSTMPRASTRC